MTYEYEPEDGLPDWVFDNDGLGFCGCGDPEGTLFWLRDLMRVLDSGDYSEARWKNLNALLGEGHSGMFVLYELDSRNWTEHGGNVNGSWLTERGQQWLHRIEELCATFATAP